MKKDEPVEPEKTKAEEEKLIKQKIIHSGGKFNYND
jgi:hypothetical protein